MAELPAAAADRRPKRRSAYRQLRTFARQRESGALSASIWRQGALSLPSEPHSWSGATRERSHREVDLTIIALFCSTMQQGWTMLGSTRLTGAMRRMGYSPNSSCSMETASGADLRSVPDGFDS